MDIPDFDQKPKRVKDLRTGDSTSFYIRPKKLLGEDIACDLHPAPIFSLDIIRKKGRIDGASVVYSPDQIYNYLSPSERDDSSINEAPAYIKNDGDTTIYGFCSSASQTGFWEVRVGGKDLFIEFNTNNLLIICPRPFRLSDLVAVNTNANFIKWAQIQGRVTIVNPDNGDGSTNPFIAIIGNRDVADPPVLLIAEAEGNPGVYEFLSIDTSIRERMPRATGINVNTVNPLLSSSCRLIPTGGTTATWDYPFYPPREFHLQRNNNGAWETLLISPTPVTFEFQFNTSYRVLAVQDKFGTIGISCVMRMTKFQCSAEEIQRVSGNCGVTRSRQFPVTSKILEVRDAMPRASGNSGIVASRQYFVRSLNRDVFDAMPRVSGSSGIVASRQYALSGIIAG